jgi:hypothetical protein
MSSVFDIRQLTAMVAALMEGRVVSDSIQIALCENFAERDPRRLTAIYNLMESCKSVDLSERKTYVSQLSELLIIALCPTCNAVLQHAVNICPSCHDQKHDAAEPHGGRVQGDNHDGQGNYGGQGHGGQRYYRGGQGNHGGRVQGDNHGGRDDNDGQGNYGVRGHGGWVQGDNRGGRDDNDGQGNYGVRGHGGRVQGNNHGGNYGGRNQRDSYNGRDQCGRAQGGNYGGRNQGDNYSGRNRGDSYSGRDQCGRAQSGNYGGRGHGGRVQGDNRSGRSQGNNYGGIENQSNVGQANFCIKCGSRSAGKTICKMCDVHSRTPVRNDDGRGQECHFGVRCNRRDTCTRNHPKEYCLCGNNCPGKCTGEGW